MAGDWIKFEVNTPEKQEVLAITVAMGWDDQDLTVGKLLRVWRWFDQQTLDGNAPSVSAALLDRIVGTVGFAKSMSDVGWLEISDDGLSLPNFDRHNGKTAKERALTAKRVALHKANGKGNATTNDQGNGVDNETTNARSVSAALPKEEKNREDIKNTPLPPEKGGAVWRLPDWIPGDLWAEFETVRKKRKKPLTDRARQMATSKLEALRDGGHDPQAVIEQTILHAWDTFYPIKSDGDGGGTGSTDQFGIPL